MAKSDMGGKKHKYGNPFDRREWRRGDAKYQNSTEVRFRGGDPKKVIPNMLKGMDKHSSSKKNNSRGK